MAFTVQTDDRIAVQDVTDRVDDAIPAGTEGSCTVFVEHTTAGVCLNEAESRLIADMEAFLDDLVGSTGWGHDEIDDNADAHLRSMLLGQSVTVPVREGRLDLGTWQSVLLVECDGPRTRTIRVLTR